MDLAWFSEVDPTWNNDAYNAYLYPESVVFANPIAQALCGVDALTASAGFPLNALFWCAGTWGSIYPESGTSGTPGSPQRTSSLLIARMISKFTRYPVPPAAEFDTSSSGAKCGGIPRVPPFLKKSQYKFNVISPIPETSGICCHTLGASTFLWGEWRNIPGTGEDHVHMMWRKRNCCLKII